MKDEAMKQGVLNISKNVFDCTYVFVSRNKMSLSYLIDIKGYIRLDKSKILKAINHAMIECNIWK